MRRYSDPVQVRSEPMAASWSDPDTGGATGDVSRVGTVGGTTRTDGADGAAETDGVRSPQAFIWQGRLYVVRQVLDHWRERRSWWRDALDPVPGQPTGIAVASREQHVWRVEASRGLAHGTGVFDLTSDGADADGADADWRLVRVAD